MNDILKRIKKDFAKNPDLIIKEVKINIFKTVYVVFLETVSSADKVNSYILKNIVDIATDKEKSFNNLNSSVPGANVNIINNCDEIEFYLTNGFSLIILNKNIIAIETRAEINRSVPTPDSEPSIIGPKDAFTENYQINLGLIKRRIKSSTLKTDNFIIGRKTNTTVGVLYIDDFVKKDLVSVVEEKLKNIDIDGITDSSTLAFLLENKDKSTFPKVLRTERPDNVANALLDGKVVILVDTTPFALILPAFFTDFINPVVDNYSKGINISFIKGLRFLCYILSIFTPAIYISLICYNQETIPTSLLINFASQRQGVPFPAIIEALIMLFVCEILRESDLRFPNSYGSAISILGALILGEAAVSAGIVSPIMIIIISLTFITSLVFTDFETVSNIRNYRFIFLLFSALYGILGWAMGIIYFLIKINSNYTFKRPYNYPIAPFDYNYFKNTVFKGDINNNQKRSKLLSDNKTRQNNGDAI